jgi:heme/copper-type cytochrome/quinol oxidase subunit 2
VIIIMGLKEAMVPASFILVAVIGIALASMNINTYMKLANDKRDKNSTNNFNFSIFILVASILALGVAGYFTFKSAQAPAPDEAAAALEEAVALAKSLPNFSTAEAAVPTTEQVQTLMTPNNVRHAQAAMDSELDKLISGLGETKQMKNAQLQARLQGLIAAAQAMSAATAAAS